MYLELLFCEHSLRFLGKSGLALALFAVIAGKSRFTSQIKECFKSILADQHASVPVASSSQYQFTEATTSLETFVRGQLTTPYSA